MSKRSMTNGKSIDALMNQLEKSKDKAKKCCDLLKRAQADFINYKRRIEQERNEWHEFAISSLIEKELTVLDSFDRALQSVPKDQLDLDWVQGVTLIYQQLVSILIQEGLSAISAQGSKFNPQYHEAVAVTYSKDLGDEIITDVLQKGYMFKDKLLRPARVVVSQHKRK
jgi:molecular chaperone GrpE